MDYPKFIVPYQEEECIGSVAVFCFRPEPAIRKGAEYD